MGGNMRQDSSAEAAINISANVLEKNATAPQVAPGDLSQVDASAPRLVLGKAVDGSFLTNNPREVLRLAASVAKHKAEYPLSVLAVDGFLAGAYLSVAGLAMTIVGGGMRGPNGLYSTNPGLVLLIQGLVFPPGLIAVVLAGADLFTGNVMYFTAGLLEGKVRWHEVARAWTASWLFNLLGSLCIALLVHWAGILGDPVPTNSTNEFAKYIAHYKTSHPWGATVIRGMLCNWLVCLALWQGLASTDVAGKILALYPPVAYFILAGFEHCVANQYLLTQGLLAGSPVSVGRVIWSNLVPSTLGCILGGMFFVGLPGWYAFGVSSKPYRDYKAKFPWRKGEKPTNFQPHG